MERHLDEHDSDMASRFAVLRYLWTAEQAAGAPDDEENAAGRRVRADAHQALADFIDRLPPEGIAGPEQLTWEFKQAFILLRWERLKRFGGSRIAGLSKNRLNLLLGRALWLCDSWRWGRW
jgi:hypothetical protein